MKPRGCRPASRISSRSTIPGRRRSSWSPTARRTTPPRRSPGFGPAVRLIEVPPGGKPAALNAGVASASGDIIVFADARQRFADGAIAALVENFSDPRVGGATGELILDCEERDPGTQVGEGIGLYWKYEKWLRRNESRVWSTLGATGAIYALRRSCWQPLPAQALLDDVLAPMRAVLNGWRVVFDDRAIAHDRASSDAAGESRRKTRTLAGNYHILAQEPRLLLPFVNPVWLQYVSHKVGRLVVPWALIGCFAAAVATAAVGPGLRRGARRATALLRPGRGRCAPGARAVHARGVHVRHDERRRDRRAGGAAART
jgi:cellulose synthase/poly-beta-1,6-N-acetylglucosamine synthase-like glycosyltransferase